MANSQASAVPVMRAGKQRPRTVLIDPDNVIAPPTASIPATPQASPLDPSPVSLAPSAFRDALARVTGTESNDAVAAKAEPRPPPTKELPGAVSHALLLDMQQFLEDETIDQRSYARLRTLLDSMRATTEIIFKLGRAPHTENNWTLVAVTMKKAAEHMTEVTTELSALLAFSKNRAHNVERLVRHANAVSAGGVPTAAALFRDDTSGHNMDAWNESDPAKAAERDYFLFPFDNQALVPYETEEHLHLSAFDVSQ